MQSWFLPLHRYQNFLRFVKLFLRTTHRHSHTSERRNVFWSRSLHVFKVYELEISKSLICLHNLVLIINFFVTELISSLYKRGIQYTSLPTSQRNHHNLGRRKMNEVAEDVKLLASVILRTRAWSVFVCFEENKW